MDIIAKCTALLSGNRQCPNEAVPGELYCSIHGNYRQTGLTVPKQVYEWTKTTYLQQLGKRAQEMSDPSKLNLREEAGLVRAMLDSILSKVNDDSDLIARSGEIQNLLLLIERLLNSTVALEQKTGNLLTREQVREFASKLLDTLIREVEKYQESENKRIARQKQDLLSCSTLDEVKEYVEAFFTPQHTTLLETVSDEFMKVIKTTRVNG